VVARYKCFSCHGLKGELGETAPDLAFEGSRIHRDWLVKYLKEPYDLRPQLDIQMPNFGLSDREVTTLADLIMGRWVDSRVPDDPFGGKSPPPDMIERGRKLYWEGYECQDCHVIEGKGEPDGPHLDGIGNRLQPGWLLKWVIDPEFFFESDMASMDVTEEDALPLTAYLMSLRHSH